MLNIGDEVDIKHKVVVLEDDPSVIDYICEGLKPYGFRVIGVRTKDEAVELARSSGIRSFVLDIQIGASGRDGLDVLEEVKDLDSGAQAYIYSRHADQAQYARQARRLEADLILEKANPRIDVLLIARQLLLHQKRMVSHELGELEREKKLTARKLEEIEVMLANRSHTGRVAASGSTEPFQPQGDLSGSAASLVSNDPNIAVYQRLLRDPAWYRANAGQVIGIVDGSVVYRDIDLSKVLAELRAAYPLSARFIKRIEPEDDIADIPTPLEVDDTHGG